MRGTLGGWFLLSLAACGGPTTSKTSAGGSDTGTGPADTAEGMTGAASTSSFATSTSTSSPGTSTGTSGEPTTGFLGPCDVVAQDCPAGHKCVLLDLDFDGAFESSCVALDDDLVPAGEVCVVGEDGRDNCGEGDVCADLDGSGNGRCVIYCGGEDDTTTCPSGPCDNFKGDGLCLSQCDPVGQDCPDSDACINVERGFVCADPGPAAVGEPCSPFDGCLAGAKCLNRSPLPGCADTACCVPYCDINDPDAALCPEGSECSQFFGGLLPPEDYLYVGVCSLPA